MANSFRPHKNLLPLLLLLALCLYTALLALADRAIIDYHHYLAFAAVALNLLVYVRFRPAFKFTLIGMLLLGLLDWLSFTPDRLSIGFGLTDTFRVNLQLLSLLVIVVYYFLNRAGVHGLLRRYVLSNPTPQQQAAAYQERVGQFKATFARKSDESLQQMLRDEALVAAAREAARQLLRERGLAPTAAP